VERTSGAGEERALLRQRKTTLRDHFHLGQLLRARNRTRAAVVEYKKAVLRAGPAHAAIWLLSDKLGKALLATDRKAEAKKAFEESLKINPHDLEAHLHLAMLLEKEKPHRAWLHLTECLRINPLDPRMHVLAAQVAEGFLKRKEGNQEKWKEHLARHKRALKLLAGPMHTEEGEASGQAEEKTASIRIQTSPWARVWLDYRDTGLTTPVFALKVEPGTHLVGLVAGCADGPVVVRVQVDEGEQVIIDRELCPKNPPEAMQTE
jgi:tetratricopeptide (TPR) repeat protein